MNVKKIIQKIYNCFLGIDIHIIKCYAVTCKKYSVAGVAQLVEQLICNQ